MPIALAGMFQLIEPSQSQAEPFIPTREGMGMRDWRAVTNSRIKKEQSPLISTIFGPGVEEVWTRKAEPGPRDEHVRREKITKTGK